MGILKIEVAAKTVTLSVTVKAPTLKLSSSAITLNKTFNDSKVIKTVAVLGGAGKSFVYEAMMTGADAYVTSEISHDLFIDAKTHNFALYDCGHYYTENPVCEKIKELLCENFTGLEVEIFDIKSPYVTY